MIAYIDESARATASGLMYVVASAVVFQRDLPEVRDELRGLLLPGQRHLHWRAESEERRMALLERVTQMPVLAYAVAAGEVPGKGQEKARARALQHLLFTLSQSGVVEVAIEARSATLNRRDAQTIAAARRHGTIPAALTYRHIRKSDDPLLWAADIVASAVATNLTSGERAHYVVLQNVLVSLERMSAG